MYLYIFRFLFLWSGFKKKSCIHKSIAHRLYNTITLYFLNVQHTGEIVVPKRVTYPVLFYSMRFQSVTLHHPSTETSRSGNTSVTSMDGAPLSYRAAYKLD